MNRSSFWNALDVDHNKIPNETINANEVVFFLGEKNKEDIEDEWKVLERLFLSS